MKTIREMADEYAASYPPEYRHVAYKAWLDGRDSMKEKKKTKSRVIDLCFVDDYFREIFEYWLNYKKEKHQAYTQSGAESCYRKLLKLSGGDRDKMIAIIDQSVSNNWAGLFELKDNNGRTNNNKQQSGTYNVFSFSEEVCESRERQNKEYQGCSDD